MPRIRTIKPEFWSSPDVEGMSPWARLLYIAMWNWADDHGRGTANPKELAAFAFPHDEQWSGAELPRILAEVADRFGVAFYTVRGRRYYAIPTWDEHQKNERRAQSKHPAPGEGEHYHPGPADQQKQSDEGGSRGASASMHGNSETTYGSSGPGTGEQGNRGTGGSPCSPPAGDESEPDASSDGEQAVILEPQPERATPRKPDRSDERFAEFWDLYPKRVAKQAALKAWRRAVRKVDPDTILAGARRYAESRRGEDPQYTAHPATWLNAGRWDDEPQPSRPPGGPPAMSTADQRIAQLQAMKTATRDDVPRGFRAITGAQTA